MAQVSVKGPGSEMPARAFDFLHGVRAEVHAEPARLCATPLFAKPATARLAARRFAAMHHEDGGAATPLVHGALHGL
jgi:hypothetical protein